MMSSQAPRTRRERSKGTSLSMELRSSTRARDTTPERAKTCRTHQQRVNKPVKKVQVVYYLSRNGLLEHPHYMELTLLPSEPLRLKDVLDRLVSLRGSGMPSLYSWSSKRRYRGGYVWYDLAVNDIIHPAEGAEYVLKGSELLEGCPERFQQVEVRNGQASPHDPNFNLKRKPFNSSLQSESILEYQEFEEQVEEYEDGEKTCYTSSTTTPHSRCSRGVSTDELDEDQETRRDCSDTQKNPTTKMTVHADSPPPSSTLTEKLNEGGIITNNKSEGHENGGLVSMPSRNSVLLQLIACGSSAVSKAKARPCVSSNLLKKSESLERGIVFKKMSEAEMIKYMSENPRFGNLQSEEKEYFSGSLLDSMKEDKVASTQPVLQKSNSYNEERSSKMGVEETMEEEKREKKQGKCIPRRNSCASSKESRK